MNWFNKHLSFKADLLVTLLNSLIVIGGVFILNGLVARIHGLEVLGEFLLVKRTLSAVVGILLIGLNVGLPNFLSRNFEKSYGDNSFIIFLFMTIPLTIIFITSIIWFNITGFHSEHFWIYIIFSLGISGQMITYALYRGYMNMIGANFFQLVGTAIIPIIVFIMVTDLYDGLYFIGSGVLIIMLFAYLMRNKGIHFHEINYYQIIKIIKYGLVRIPSFIAQFILLAGITFIAYSKPHRHGFTMDDVANFLNIFLKAGIVFSVIGTTFCFINAPFILQIWLGEVSDAGINILRLAILALPFYTFSGLTRSPIDAISEKGYNSLIYGVAATSMIVIIYIGNHLGYDLITTALISFVISHIIAALGGALIIKKLYNYRLWNFELSRDIISSIIIMFVIHQLFSLLHFSAQLEFFTTSAAYAIVGILIFKYVKTGWLAELKSKLYAS